MTQSAAIVALIQMTPGKIYDCYDLPYGTQVLVKRAEINKDQIMLYYSTLDCPLAPGVPLESRGIWQGYFCLN